MTRSYANPRRAFLAGAGASLVAASAWGQQKRIPHVAYLSASPAGDFRSEEVRQGLRELGYVEGTNLVIDYFLAASVNDLPLWAEKAVSSKPDVIVAASSVAVVAAKAQTSVIPIVHASPGDPVALGFAASFARPGGNVTGPSGLVADVAAKRLQILSQLVPHLTRVVALYQLGDPQSLLSLPELSRAGKILGINVRAVGIARMDELRAALADGPDGPTQALFIVGAAFFANDAKTVAAETARRRLPSISDSRIHADAGGLVTYGANVRNIYRRAAYYVDRILKGAKPADLPIEQPTVFDFVINKRTADGLGLVIPSGLWVQATEILK